LVGDFAAALEVRDVFFGAFPPALAFVAGFFFEKAS
jgi:hypothetical protein